MELQECVDEGPNHLYLRDPLGTIVYMWKIKIFRITLEVRAHPATEHLAPTTRTLVDCSNATTSTID